MGQYYRPAIINAENEVKTLNAQSFGASLKLTENLWPALGRSRRRFGQWTGDSFINAVISMIHNNPSRVAWIGDYSNEYQGDAYEKLPLEEFIAYYDKVWKTEECTIPAEMFSEEDMSIINKKVKKSYFINHTKKVYIDLGAYIARNTCRQGINKGFCFNPLPLLTACGNGRGGGDYFSEIGLADVGTWAFDVIEYSNIVPEGYESVVYEFREWENEPKTIKIGEEYVFFYHFIDDDARHLIPYNAHLCEVVACNTPTTELVQKRGGSYEVQFEDGSKCTAYGSELATSKNYEKGAHGLYYQKICVERNKSAGLQQ